MIDEAVKDDIEEEDLELDQHLVFKAKSQEFGIQAVRVQEIDRILPITEVPNAPSYIEGIMNLRGRLASVVNFRKKLGFQSREHDEDTRVIVVELGTFPVGIIVDSVEEVIKIPNEKVQKLPESTTTAVSRDYMTGVGMLDDRVVILLDVDKVLSGTELIELGKIDQILKEGEETSNSADVEEPAKKPKKVPNASESKAPDTRQPTNLKRKPTKGRAG
ncbi:MAG: chemotaxis protein CheW [Dehalococcoidia bacterium]|nr:chemotaxis protein CheW [Dehalococcoidia bacterium]